MRYTALNACASTTVRSMRGTKSWQFFLPKTRVKCPHCGQVIHLKGSIKVKSVSLESFVPTAGTSRAAVPMSATSADTETDSATDES